MSRVSMLLGLLVALVLTSTSEAQLFRRWRAASTCTAASCQRVVVSGAVQKADPVVQKDEAPVQKEETPVQKDEAVQKEAVQKTGAVQSGVVVTGNSVVAAICARKANILARRGYGGHVGGSFGGCRFEGWGAGPTPAAARANACYWGQRLAVASACARSGRTWFAVVLYR